MQLNVLPLTGIESLQVLVVIQINRGYILSFIRHRPGCLGHFCQAQTHSPPVMHRHSARELHASPGYNIILG